MLVAPMVANHMLVANPHGGIEVILAAMLRLFLPLEVIFEVVLAGI
jgi:hypothetical protein